MMLLSSIFLSSLPFIASHMSMSACPPVSAGKLQVTYLTECSMAVLSFPLPNFCLIFEICSTKPPWKPVGNMKIFRYFIHTHGVVHYKRQSSFVRTRRVFRDIKCNGDVWVSSTENTLRLSRAECAIAGSKKRKRPIISDEDADADEQESFPTGSPQFRGLTDDVHVVRGFWVRCCCDILSADGVAKEKKIATDAVNYPSASSAGRSSCEKRNRNPLCPLFGVVITGVAFGSERLGKGMAGAAE